MRGAVPWPYHVLSASLDPPKDFDQSTSFRRARNTDCAFGRSALTNANEENIHASFL
jgi:hypothetical protein